MIDIKIPCSIGSILRDNKDKKEYIVIQYEIKGHFNLLFAVLSDVNNESSMEYMILIKDGQLPDNFEIIDDIKVKENICLRRFYKRLVN